jgi:hypothetical protein
MDLTLRMRVGPIKSETSRPRLWIGNTADPIIPDKMAQRFKGSVVLQRDSEGVWLHPRVVGGLD